MTQQQRAFRSFLNDLQELQIKYIWQTHLSFSVEIFNTCAYKYSRQHVSIQCLAWKECNITESLMCDVYIDNSPEFQSEVLNEIVEFIERHENKCK